jgi:outer membrane biosynthesis protein TonB
VRRRPGPAALGTSLAIHLILVVPLAVFARPPAPIQFETYRVNLVAAPAEVLQPEPAPPAPEPQPEPVQPEPEPEPEAEARDAPPEPEREPEPDVEKPPETPEARPQPTEDTPAEAGGGEVNLSIEGLEFPFPVYLANVQTQLLRYFRWNEENHPKGTIYFEITPDGQVRNIKMVQPSGNLRFDFAARGAVETAGNRGAFGPLPEEYAGPFLPVLLEIEPPR